MDKIHSSQVIYVNEDSTIQVRQVQQWIVLFFSFVKRLEVFYVAIWQRWEGKHRLSNTVFVSI